MLLHVVIDTQDSYNTTNKKQDMVHAQSLLYKSFFLSRQCLKNCLVSKPTCQIASNQGFKTENETNK